MGLIRLEPEVAGGLGPGIDFDADRRPPLVGPLHYEFIGWLGDDIVETAGYWIVTAALADALSSSRLTGFEIAEVVATRSDEFLSSGADPLLETWRRLVPIGGVTDDVTLERTSTILVSREAFELFRRWNLSHAEITPADRLAPISGALQTYLERRGIVRS